MVLIRHELVATHVVVVCDEDVDGEGKGYGSYRRHRPLHQLALVLGQEDREHSTRSGEEQERYEYVAVQVCLLRPPE